MKNNISYCILKANSQYQQQLLKLREENLYYPIRYPFNHETALNVDRSALGIFVAIDTLKDQVVGCLYLLKKTETELWLQQMAVDNNYRKHKIGTNLVRIAENWTSDAGYESIFLNGRLYVKDFYLSCGYVIQSAELNLSFSSTPHLHFRKFLPQIFYKNINVNYGAQKLLDCGIKNKLHQNYEQTNLKQLFVYLFFLNAQFLLLLQAKKLATALA